MRRRSRCAGLPWRSSVSSSGPGPSSEAPPARSLRANRWLGRDSHFASEARIPALRAEVESASRVLSTPAARLIADGDARLILLHDVEELYASKKLIVDACRSVVLHAGDAVSLATRPVLF